MYSSIFFLLSVSHFAGRRVFSFPKNSSRERLDSLLPLATQMKKSGQNQAVGNIWLWYFCLLQRRFPFIALAVIPTSNTKVLKSFFTSRSSSLVKSSHERVFSDKLHRFLWRKINEVSKEMDGKKHRVLPGIKTIWQQLLFSNKSYFVGFSLFLKFQG